MASDDRFDLIEVSKNASPNLAAKQFEATTIYVYEHESSSNRYLRQFVSCRLQAYWPTIFNKLNSKKLQELHVTVVNSPVQDPTREFGHVAEAKDSEKAMVTGNLTVQSQVWKK